MLWEYLADNNYLEAVLLVPGVLPKVLLEGVVPLGTPMSMVGTDWAALH